MSAPASNSTAWRPTPSGSFAVSIRKDLRDNAAMRQHIATEMSAEDRRALRQTEALPILVWMKARFEEVRPTLRPTAKLAEAIDYGKLLAEPVLLRMVA